MGDGFNITLRNPGYTGVGNFNIVLSDTTRRIFVVS